MKDFACSSNDIKIDKIDFAFRVEVGNEVYVYVQCSCCDSDGWFEQCKPASDKSWLGLCSSEARFCLDKCMEARKLCGLGDYADSNILCKEIDDEYLAHENDAYGSKKDKNKK